MVTSLPRRRRFVRRSTRFVDLDWASLEVEESFHGSIVRVLVFSLRVPPACRDELRLHRKELLPFTLLPFTVPAIHSLGIVGVLDALSAHKEGDVNCLKGWRIENWEATTESRLPVCVEFDLRRYIGVSLTVMVTGS